MMESHPVLKVTKFGKDITASVKSFTVATNQTPSFEPPIPLDGIKITTIWQDIEYGIWEPN